MKSDTAVEYACETDAELATIGMSGAHARMYELIYGATVVQMIRCAALYRFADHLTAGRATPAVIAAAEGLDVDATRRLMRGCAGLGLMIAQENGHYSATPLLATLREDDPSRLRQLAITQAGAGHWKPWGLMDQALKTGRPQAKAALGMSFWDYIASDEGADEGNAFATLFMGLFEAIDQAASARLDTRQLEVVADIGGGEGALLRALMHANPFVKGVLFDLPHIALRAAELPDNVALTERLAIEGASFFETAPCADLYLLRTVLHDWSDEECVMLLRRCRQAAKPGARLAVIEMVIDDSAGALFPSQMDLTMMIVVGGRERTRAEFAALLSESGFELQSVEMLCHPFSLIEAIAV